VINISTPLDILEDLILQNRRCVTITKIVYEHMPSLIAILLFLLPSLKKKYDLQECMGSYTVKPVLNGISRDQNIFPLQPGFRLIKVHYIQYKKLNQDMQTLTLR